MTSPSWLPLQGSSTKINDQLLHEGLVTSVEIDLDNRERVDQVVDARAHAAERQPRCPECAVLQSALFMDDMVFPVTGEASEIVGRASRATAIVFNQLAAHMLRMNTDQGKSEVMFHFAGRGAKQAKIDLFVSARAQMKFTHVHGEACLNATQVYKHVGSQTVLSGTLAPEIAFRVNSMSGVKSDLRRQFWRNSDVPVSCKLSMARVLMLSRGLYLAGTWPQLRQNELLKINNAVLEIYQMCAREKGCYKPVPYDELVKHHAMIAPSTLVLQLRLALLTRVCARGPPDLLGLLLQSRGTERSWLCSALSDLKLVVDLTTPFVAFKGGDEQHVLCFMASSAKSFRRKLSSAVSEQALNEPRLWATSEKVRESLCSWQCAVCNLDFPTKSALATHSFLKHGLKRSCRSKVILNSCPVCLCLYHTRSRLIDHVQVGSPTCRDIICQFFVDEPPGDILIVEDAERERVRKMAKLGRHRNWAEFPAVRLPGPLIKSATNAGISRRGRPRAL